MALTESQRHEYSMGAKIAAADIAEDSQTLMQTLAEGDLKHSREMLLTIMHNVGTLNHALAVLEGKQNPEQE